MLPDEKTSVRVAVRVRPLSVRERAEFQKPCLAVSDTESQIIIGTERAFTFDYTFDCDSEQEDIFSQTTKDLIDGCFKGLNATILAYGQTGSGKTYSMGTGFDVSIPTEQLGIVPRAVDYMFSVMQNRHQEHMDHNRTPPLFDVLVQFIELYQDELVDLLDRATRSARGKRVKPPRLGEDKNGNVILHNVCKKPVSSREDIMDWLKQGALARTTGSTNMNAQSSRSHAIFTVEIKQTIQQLDENENPAEFLTTAAKFHFVDLAGSERLKRTHATGERQKEGISINCGLLALGNVISKLGDKNLKATHIPYRESKLTRLLQDSLGGNSRTLMIACVSPAEQDFVETLNTLRYANRARNIQNKVVSNQDKTGQTISTLRARILDLERELMEFQQGKRQPGVEAYNDMFVENSALQKENEELRSRLRHSEENNKRLQENVRDRDARIAELRAESDRMKELLGGGSGDGPEISSSNLTDMEKMRMHYTAVIEATETKLREANKEIERMQTSQSHASPSKLSNGSGSKTYRVPRRTFAITPPMKMDPMEFYPSDDTALPRIEASIGDDDALESEEDIHSIVSDIDEQIREKEEKLLQMKLEMDSQKANYEAKILQLTSRIGDVEAERNAFLKEMKLKKGNFDPEKAKERELKFAHDLDELKRQLKEQHDVKNDYKKLQKDFSANEKKVSSLSQEIAALKKVRCETIKKAEQDFKKAREKDLQQARVMSQKDKEFRLLKKQNADLKGQVFQLNNKVVRLTADLKVAKRTQKTGMSDQVAGRVNKASGSVVDEGLLKRNWEEFLRYFRAVTYKRMRLKQFEKQLSTYSEELRGLREACRNYERKLALAVEARDFAAVETLKSQLDDTRSTIHFFEQKNMEVQNETAVCEENPDELNSIDPLYIQMHFPDEPSTRYFLGNLIDLCMSQQEQMTLQDTRAQSKAAEHAIMKRELNVVREILQMYIVDNAGQSRLTIADVAKNLEQNGVTELSAEDVLDKIKNTPVSSRTLSRTKARQLTLNGPEDMLMSDKSRSGSSTGSSTAAGSPVGSSDSDRTSSSSGVTADMTSLSQKMGAPKIIPLKRVMQDIKQRAKNGSTSGHPFVPPLPPNLLNGHGTLSTPLRPPNRSISLSEIIVSPSKHGRSPGHGSSLENMAASPSTSQLGKVRRHACQTQLNMLSKPSTSVQTPVGKR